MSPVAQGAIVVCVVVLSAVLVSTLLALRRTALRAENVLHVVEREIRPMLTQLESLTAELRELSRTANDEMKRISVILRRVDDVSIKVARLVGALAALTQVGRYVGVVAGVKKGLDVFVRRLGARR